MHRPRFALTRYAQGRIWSIWILKDGKPAMTGPGKKELRLNIDPRELSDRLPPTSNAPSIDAFCARQYTNLTGIEEISAG